MFAFPPEHIFSVSAEIRTLSPAQLAEGRSGLVPERWPAPKNADAPVGCPDNPYQTDIIQIALDYEALGFEPQEHLHPATAERFAASLRRPSVPIFGIALRREFEAVQVAAGERPEDADRFCSEYTREQVSTLLFVCFSSELENNSLWKHEILDLHGSRIAYVADEDEYRFPNGDTFSLFCRVGVRNVYQQRCRLNYLIHESLKIRYAFQLAYHPLQQIMPIDNAFREYINEKVELSISQPYYGETVSFPLPTISQ